MSTETAKLFRLWQRLALALLLAGLLLTAGLGLRAGDTAAAKPPETRRDAVKEVLHGVELADPYRWLEDQQSPETRAWIEAQNAYTQSRLGAVPGRDRLKQRLTELIRIDAVSAPFEANGRYFFSRRRADQDLFVLYLRKGARGKDEVLVDPHSLSADKTVSVTFVDVSSDGTVLAYGVRQGGEDELTLKFMDIDTQQHWADELPRARYFGVSLRPDKKGFYYSRHGQEGSRIYYHRRGSDPAGDAKIFGDGYGPDKIVASGLSESGRWLLINVLHGSAADKTDVYVQNVAEKGAVVPIVNDIQARFSPDLGGDTLFLQTNWQAPNGRILAVDLKNPARENWKEIVPESQEAVIRGFSAAGGRLFVSYLENVRSIVKVFTPEGKRVHDISFPALGTVSGVGGRWEGKEAFFTFSSYHIPTTIYRYDVKSKKQEVWARLEVPVDSAQFEVEQVWYESKDKTKIPMWLVHKKGLKRDGTHPAFLTGYGGFNLSLTPQFSSTAVLWAERGGVYAVPNLRGGGELGEKWHRAGMRENKQNVFDDFIAAAQWLIANGYTSPERLAVSGGSNGGLLVGAMMTQRPELFRAVVCSYPLLDMIRYHQFLVARFWVPEYGSSDDPDEFKYLLAYSPYQNVKPGTKYPAVLFISGDSDTRVAPLHARKMAALVQAATGSERPVLLHYDTKSGHSGGQPVSKQIEDATDSLSFLFWQLGVGTAEPAVKDEKR